MVWCIHRRSSERNEIMYERRNYLKRAFYHLMKIEMKKNKALAFEGYHQANAELARKYAAGEIFESSTIFMEDGMLCITEDFLRLSFKEQDALVQFFAENLDDIEE